MLPLPLSKKSDKAFRIYTDQGKSVIEIERVFRDKERLCMEGRLMGQFDTTVNIGVEDFFKLIRLILAPSPLCFVLLSPVYWMKGKIGQRRKAVGRDKEPRT